MTTPAKCDATVVTVTLNPAIDQTVMLERLVPGEVHRAASVRFDAGGKGVNVASCLGDRDDLAVVATGLLGSENADVFNRLMRDKRIENRFVRVAGANRTNIKIVDDRGTTDINLPGFAVMPAMLDAAAEAAEAFAAPGRLMVLAGSLPTGADGTCYAALLARLSARGARIVLDASGSALRTAIDGAVMPYAIKPNRDELAELVGRDLADIGNVAHAAAELHRRGIALVVVSMGADGALFLSAEGALRAALPPVSQGSTVGAGDAMVAGIVSALVEGGDLERIARLGTAFAVGKLGLAGPHLPARGRIEALAAETHIDAIELGGERA